MDWGVYRIGDERVFLDYANGFETIAATFDINSIGFHGKSALKYVFCKHLFVETNVNLYHYLSKGEQINQIGYPNTDNIKVHKTFVTGQVNVGICF